MSSSAALWPPCIGIPCKHSTAASAVATLNVSASDTDGLQTSAVIFPQPSHCNAMSIPHGGTHVHAGGDWHAGNYLHLLASASDFPIGKWSMHRSAASVPIHTLCGHACMLHFFYSWMQRYDPDICEARGWILDNGEIPPARKLFTDAHFHAPTNTFHGTVTWDPPASWRNTTHWEVCATFVPVGVRTHMRDYAGWLCVHGCAYMAYMAVRT